MRILLLLKISNYKNIINITKDSNFNKLKIIKKIPNINFNNRLSLTNIFCVNYTNFPDLKRLNLIYFSIYQQEYFKKLLTTNNILIKTFNTAEIIPLEFLSYLMYSLRNIRWKRYFLLFANEVIEIVFISLYFKNTNMLVSWIRKYFEKTVVKKHKKLFYFIQFMFKNLIWNYNWFLQLKGLRLSLRGKFSKSGSIRKIRKYIKNGKISSTSKNLAINIKKFVIRTPTGVFSLKFEIFYIYVSLI